MKVNVELDCTPEEARRFFGLPDLSPVHEAYVERLQGLAREGVSADDVEKMFAAWTGGIAGGAQQLQAAMLAAMSGDADRKDD